MQICSCKRPNELFLTEVESSKWVTYSTTWQKAFLVGYLLDLEHPTIQFRQTYVPESNDYKISAHPYGNITLNPNSIMT